MKKNNDLILQLCHNVINEGVHSDNVKCDGIDCYDDKCPFNGLGLCCTLRSPDEAPKIAQAYLNNTIETELKTLQEVLATIEEGETWVGCKNAFGNPEIKMENNGIHISFGCKTGSYSFWNHTLFQLKRKEFDFVDILKSFSEGEQIKSVVSGIAYKKLDDDKILAIYENDKTETLPANNSLFSAMEIQGKWYIY